MSDTEPSDSQDVSEDHDQLEQERQERLDPQNRPANAEVDNTGRQFDPVKGEFTYAPGEEPDGEDHAQAIIGADRPDGVESDVEQEDASGGTT
jgi:hypothetical protein